MEWCTYAPDPHAQEQQAHLDRSFASCFLVAKMPLEAVLNTMGRLGEAPYVLEWCFGAELKELQVERNAHGTLLHADGMEDMPARRYESCDKVCCRLQSATFSS